MHGHPSAVLYLDLSQAFDLAIREAILGIATWNACRDIGLFEENIQLLSAKLRDEGSSPHQAGVSPVVTRLLNSLHTGAWCKLDGEEHMFFTRRGGSQGCLHGPSFFQHGVRHGALSQVRQKTHVAQLVCSGGKTA